MPGGVLENPYETTAACVARRSAVRQAQRLPVDRLILQRTPGDNNMNRIIWLVGLVVIVLFLAGYFGLR